MESRNYKNLTINPCKMCMPMGAVMAFKGIENSMMILHGSQGCSTYIRRHMATHYNEPVDIASSSLTEQGTVYGGAENLIKGIQNVIQLYDPQIIGVATTCLAETIGEDIERMITEFTKRQDLGHRHIIPVSTPGYGGTQFEGYFKALKAIVQKLCGETTRNHKINIIIPGISPGDIRHIKEILNVFGIEYNLFPDISETLDAPYSEKYSRIPAGGTKIVDIQSMPGAAATIEMGITASLYDSPGAYLYRTFGVPLYRCSIPIGIQNTDRFIRLISEITGKSIPVSLGKQRGRLIDGMIDSHKYNGEGRAVIFGEPEWVYALTQLCLENGIRPVLTATGTKNEKLKKLLMEELTKGGQQSKILDDTDFTTIQKYAKEYNANLLIGNSDGKWIEEKEGIPLVRIGFPVHDRVGAQRKNYVGYEGSLNLLDELTNTLLEKKETTYRERMYQKYYHPRDSREDNLLRMMVKAVKPTNNVKSTNEQKTLTHPCYHHGAHAYARMHLPVAPKCNISCNYCSRKYDCANESRPGVTSTVLSPGEALEKFIEIRSKMDNLKVVGIAGPGDALANFEQVRETLELIQKEDPDITFCVSTNGLMLPFYANELIDLGVSHVTVTVNAVNPQIGAEIYRYVNYLGNKLKGEEAAAILLNNQLIGLKYLASKGVVCKVNIVMMKGINDHHIEEVVQKAKECGAYMTNIMKMIPVGGSAFEKLPVVSDMELGEVRTKCEANLKQMYHCRQCRADAVGTLSDEPIVGCKKKLCSTG